MNEILKQCESAFYVFDLERARARIRFLRAHLPEGVALCYAVKANTFIIGGLLRDVERFEICSPGEAEICEKLGVPGNMMVISGVYKTPSVMEHLVASGGDRTYTVESLTQFALLREAEKRSGIFMAGLAYIPLLLLPAPYLSTTKLIFVLAAVAVSDTSAYFVGTRFGHHKLWPRVSPNKSSEGAVGSLVGCVIFCTIYGACLGSASWWAFALLGIAINAFAQLGDLFESALKRAVHVKDSSNLLPGHGGILDRADSILFAMPMFAVVDQWFFFF